MLTCLFLCDADNSCVTVCMYVCCRRGNDSQLAVVLLKEMLTKELSSSQQFKLQDIIGGLNAWADVVDQTFPKY